MQSLTDKQKSQLQQVLKLQTQQCAMQQLQLLQTEETEHATCENKNSLCTSFKVQVPPQSATADDQLITPSHLTSSCLTGAPFEAPSSCRSRHTITTTPATASATPHNADIHLVNPHTARMQLNAGRKPAASGRGGAHHIPVVVA